VSFEKSQTNRESQEAKPKEENQIITELINKDFTFKRPVIYRSIIKENTKKRVVSEVIISDNDVKEAPILNLKVIFE
jgi:hypothetical protein